jgi:GH25 family lysozyme M1 (1,4-beta-N-acetylmuramidase)
MTQFLWDTSHYDGPLSVATLRTAHAQGIVALTRKVGEGTGGDDPLDGTVLAAARDAGIPLLGGYHVVRSGPVGPQVDALLLLAERAESWWHTFPGWFWQVDLERWPYDAVPAATGIAFAQELRRRTGKVVALYASRGQYGDQLTAWDGPLWNARYVSGAGDFRSLYPGDGWVGWDPYSGRRPDFLQYASSATIAGVTTSDISAFRGTLAELTALLTGGDMALRDDPDFLALIKRVEALFMGKATADFQIPGEKTARHEENELAFMLGVLANRVGPDAGAVASALAGNTNFAPAVADAVAAALVADPKFLTALAKAVNDNAAARLAQ